MRARVQDLLRRLKAAWPEARELARNRDLAREWVLGARRAQIAFAITVVAGFLVFAPLRDVVVDAIHPPRRSRSLFGRGRDRPNPKGSVLRTGMTSLWWLTGLGTTAALLVLHAPAVRGRREDEAEPDEQSPGADISVAATMAGPAAPKSDAQATAATMAGPGAPKSDAQAVAATMAAGADAGTDASESSLPRIPGDRYAVIEEIGRGGMGVVYRAKDPVLGRVVALKELPRALVRDATLAERFRIEARVLARLTHSGIVQVFDFVENEHGMWMAMELVLGGSLDGLLEKKGPLPVDELTRLGAQMARALAYAHREGVIHRDFKPHNVLLTREGEPKITDFGLAKIAREGPKLTQAGAIMGSPAYMSPEQASGKETDNRTDVYAFAVTLFEMAAGRCPFVGDTAAVMVGHLTQEAPTLTELAPDAPPALAELLASMLAKDPADRPADLEEVAKALDELHA